MAEPSRRVRVRAARAVAILGLAAAIVGMLLVGVHAGTDGGGLIPLVLGTVALVLALPFCGLNEPRPH